MRTRTTGFWRPAPPRRLLSRHHPRPSSQRERRARSPRRLADRRARRQGRSYSGAVADPSMSTGFRTLAAAGKTCAGRLEVSDERGVSSNPAASHASAQRIPRPPAFVTTATRFPRGSGSCANRVATSRRSSSESDRITPASWKSASTAASGPGNAAVCEPPRAPAALMPLFSARTGFVPLTRRATRANLRGFPNDSRYSRTRSVPGRLPSTPTGRSTRRPPCFRRHEGREAERPFARTLEKTSPRAPLCDAKPMRPGGKACGANVALRRAAVLANPEAIRADQACAVRPHESRAGRARAPPLGARFPRIPRISRRGLWSRERARTDQRQERLRRGGRQPRGRRLPEDRRRSPTPRRRRRTRPPD